MREELAEELNKIRQPYNVGVPAEAAALASLQDREYLFANVRRIVAERERLRQRLAALPLGRVYPSETNFLYWATDGVDAGDLQAALTKRGVLVRSYNDPVEALRISIGKPEESDVLMAELDDVYGELFPG
jgi:histidinol-phosphate aminotransferase